MIGEGIVGLVRCFDGFAVILRDGFRQPVDQFLHRFCLFKRRKGIPDPFGLSLTDYRHTRDILRKAVIEWVNPSVFRVVPMAAEHIPALAALEKECFADPWSENGLAEELDNPCAHFLVAEHHEEVWGYMGTHIVADEMSITNIAVKTEFRRHGVARALLQEAYMLACNKGLSRITLEVRVSNEAAIRLYESMGYVKDGIRPRFYAHPTEDAAIYSLYLGESQ